MCPLEQNITSDHPLKSTEQANIRVSSPEQPTQAELSMLLKTSLNQHFLRLTFWASSYYREQYNPDEIIVRLQRFHEYIMNQHPMNLRNKLNQADFHFYKKYFKEMMDQ